MADPVTVAIPVLNGGALLSETLAAVRAQRLDRPVELLVADSGSSDGSPDVAERHGARVIAVAPGDYSHGGTRNLLASEASGAHVAFLTQDATPAADDWLARLLDGFALADDVGLVFGPYRPRESASHMVRRELEQWFASFAPDGRPRVDRAGSGGGQADERRRAYFTDANGCVARAAWERVPFREVSYAEDQLLARDMLDAGYAKVFQPRAAVIHSHDHPPLAQLRRSFDEHRALREVRGIVPAAAPIRLALGVQRNVRDDVAFLRRDGAAGGRIAAGAARSLAHHAARAVGAALGSRADRLPGRVQRALSLERREGFQPVGPGAGTA